MEAPGLRLLPAEPRDRGSQRCRLGPRALAALGVRLGGPLRVCVADGVALCTAWPRADRADGFLQLDAKCVSPGFPAAVPRGLSLGLGQLQPVGCSRARRVGVRAVVSEGAGDPRTQPQLLRGLLKGVYLSAGLVVRLAGPEASACAGGLLQLEVCWLDPPTAGAALLTAGAEVEVAEVLSPERYRAEARGSAEALEPGSKPALASLREALAWPLLYPKASARLGLRCPGGVLLFGPPGVGKTWLLRRLALELGASVIEVSASALLGPRPGDSERRLRRLFGRAGAERRPCLLFIDQLDAVFPRRAARGRGAEHRLLAQLLGLLDSPERRTFALVGATDRPEALDPALRRPGRFDREITIGVPTLLQRQSILEAVTARMPLSADVNVSWLAEATSGYVGADLRALCCEAALQVIRRSSQDSIRQWISMTDFQEALKVVYPSSLRSSIGLTDFRPVHWDQIGGLDQVKLKIRQSIEWPLKFPEAFVRMGVRPSRGILLYGPPGCAKTTLVKAIASSCRCSLLSVSGAELFSPFVGDSEKALAKVFRQARAVSPSILFLDEIDSIVGSRSSDPTNGHRVQERVLSVLLNEMDGIGHPLSERRGTGNSTLCKGDQSKEQARKLEFQEICNKEVIVIAATNRPDLLDDALLRPGRFDQIIFVPPPGEETRLSILKICTSKTPLDGVCLRELGAETAGFTGADLQNLCKEAALLALQETGLDAAAVKHSHFTATLHSFKPSLTDEHLAFYHNLFSAKDPEMCGDFDPRVHNP
ncbi:ATPase family gene 2 protein homolog B isoform X1 [Narcine bancroftii]|uniref:ATPase family gene 2 protein homolog B isoform X1 n=1 Tax=Narcine bancroftii TaxID=1343680 RepID=UPI003831A0CB